MSITPQGITDKEFSRENSEATSGKEFDLFLNKIYFN